ncbi:MAG: MBL fold metallo-hydrolase [Bacteroidales bacterium]|nr:MBL fold metallo-hydrolase [Bacteroidales bacterium]HOY39017.1 MBL fold metallo-hydrolase [Bacteroidales bacterium]HQP03158.1 MBL fold metallo-hydrolase [Bacteroidales bacterium]
MKVISIETMRFRVDGGAMFGVIPKTMWSKHHSADQNNMVELACRSLLIDNGERRILVDTGLGKKMNFQELKHYAAENCYSLDLSLNEAGYTSSDITDVINTHYHFDHCGGNTIIDPISGNIIPAFENAVYYISKSHFETSIGPNYREKTSFMQENFVPLKEAGKLRFLDNECELIPGVSVRFFNGHTRGLTAVMITKNSKTLVFTGDMLPAAAFVPLSWISAYDIEPLKTLEEKQQFFKEAIEKDYTLFFQHDALHECGSLIATERGVRINKTFDLATW